MRASSLKSQCVTEITNSMEFSINVTQHITVESGECIVIPYEFTYPTRKISIPYTKIWFKGDPHNYVNTKVVQDLESERKGTFKLHGLPQGEYEYGFKLEWRCNQTYIFPERVRISVSALTQRPVVVVPPLMEGENATLSCSASILCTGTARIHWKWTNADGRSELLPGDFQWLTGNILHFIPQAHDHSAIVTCVAVYNYSVVETTFTLTVKSQPKFLHGSQCIVEGELLTCVCISQGFPLPPIIWPVASLTEYSVSSSRGVRTVSSTIAMSTTEYHNTSVKCISSNELGHAEIDLPLQNNTAYWSDWRKKLEAALPWITAGLSLSLNLALLSSLIIICKRGKSRQKKSREEENTYVSLDKADVEQEYSAISPQPR
uniref:myeloid cell surface antigen CD33-like n=1 Tax=Centroberyx gerrardi TaxID=166262 RepID=UPI003AABAA4E